MKDWIGIYNNALSKNNCEFLIHEFESMTDKHEPGVVASSVGGKVVLDKEKKDSTDVGLFLYDESPISKIILNSLKTNINKYIEQFPEVCSLANWGFSSGFNMRKYSPGQGYHFAHCEACNLFLSNRVLAWMFYLNTLNDGGGTRFVSYDRITPAKEGCLLIWPAQFTHVHHGIVSQTETKYIVTGWCKFLKTSNIKKNYY